jgi:ATP-dependent Lon protease
LDKLIKTYYPHDYDERKSQFQEELNELIGNEDEIPIFVCTLALPFVSCPLHIYEPRYRLMIRRAIETGKKQFGMCMYTEQTAYRFTEYGCLLDITDHQFTSDGRAIIATVGSRRFKVVSTFSKDGYNMAQVEWLVDQRVTDPNERAELQQLHDEVYKLSKDMFDLIPDAQRTKINEIYGIGEFPAPEADIQENDNGPMWHWFLLNILPLQNEFQYRFLVKSSLKERLCQLKKIVLYLIPQFEKSKQIRRCSSTTSSQTAEFVQQTQPQQQQQQQQQQNLSQANSDEVQSNESSDLSTNSNSSLH